VMKRFKNTSPLIHKFVIPAIALIVLALLVQRMPTMYQHVMISFCVGIILGQSWNLSGGYGGLFSFGHAAFFGTGAYISSLLFVKIGINPWIGMLVGGAAAILLAVFIGYIFLRLKGIYFAIATLGFAEVLRVSARNLKNVTGGEEGVILSKIPSFHIFNIEILNFSDKMAFFYIALLIALVLFIITHFITNSKMGYYLMTNREDEEVAESLGIDTLTCKIFALSVSALFYCYRGGSLF